MIVNALVGGLAVFVFDLVLILSVFNLWQKFAKKFHRHVPSSSLEQIEAMEREQMRVETEIERITGGDEIWLYNDEIVIVSHGIPRTVPLSQVQKVKLLRTGGKYLVTVTDAKRVYSCVVPVRRNMLKIFRQHLYCPVVAEKQKVPRERRRIEIDKEMIGGIVMGLICVGVGAGVIAMHYCLSAEIPVFLGLFFICGGLIVSVGVPLGQYKAGDKVIVPLLFGMAFLVFSVGFLAFMVGEKQTGTLLKLFVAESYTISLIGFALLGGFFVVTALCNLAKLIKNR